MVSESSIHRTTDGFAAAIGRHAAARPDAIALVCGDREISFNALHRAACRAANALLAAGVEPGCRIGYLGYDDEYRYELLLAAAYTRAVLVPINRRLTVGEIAYVLSDARCRLLFVDAAFESTAAQAVQSLPDEIGIVRTDENSGPGAGLAAWSAPFADYRPHPAVPPLQPLLQMYTSGTTGRPKGVIIAQESLLAMSEIRRDPLRPWLTVPDGERCLVAIPSFHMAGLTWVAQGLVDGGCSVLLPDFTPGSALATLRTRTVTALCAVPAMLAMLVDEPGVSRTDFTALRQVAYAGSPISEQLLARCLSLFGCDFLQFYGATETATPITFLPPQDHRIGSPRLRSAGHPHAGADIVVLDRMGRRLPAGAVGEIVVRGPAPMLGYWNEPEATAHTLTDGWIHTGDAGWLDQDDYLYICDRIKDMIIVAGENVYPTEVDNAIAEHPAVREAAVVGVPDDRWGEAVHAFVVRAPGHSVTARELALYLRGRLASFKCPKHIEFIDALPRNAAGKLLRRELREPFWRGRARAVN